MWNARMQVSTCTGRETSAVQDFNREKRCFRTRALGRKRSFHAGAFGALHSGARISWFGKLVGGSA